MKGKLKSIGAVASLIIDNGSNYVMYSAIVNDEVEYIIECDDYLLVPAMCRKFGTTIEMEYNGGAFYQDADGYMWYPELFEEIYGDECEEEDSVSLDEIEAKIMTILTRITYIEKKQNIILEALEGDYED